MLIRRKKGEAFELGEKLILVNIEPSVCYLVISNSWFVSNESLKTLDYVNYHDKFDKTILN